MYLKIEIFSFENSYLIIEMFTYGTLNSYFSHTVCIYIYDMISSIIGVSL